MKMTEWVFLRAVAGLILLSGPLVRGAESEGRWLADGLTGVEVWDDDSKASTVISWSGGDENGRASGPGVMSIFEEGKLIGRYLGTMRDGRAEGSGRAHWLEGGNPHSYIGSFSDGVPHGLGTITFPDGSTLKSEFVRGEIGIYGVYRGANGERYDGELKGDLPDGEGLYISEDGEAYEGGFVEGKRSGEGKLVLPDGTVITGEFAEDELRGFGAATFPEGGSYEGQMKDDMATGQGIYRAPDGTVYEGQFISNKPDGKFKVTKPDGSTAIEVWAQGEKKIW